MSPRYANLSQTMFDNPNKTGGLVMDFSNYPTSWPNTTTYERGMGNPIPDLLQGSTTRPRSYSNNHGVSSVECFNGVSDSNSALSLLSNQPWTSRGQSSSSLGVNVNNFLGTNGSHGSTMVQSSVNHGAAIGQIAGPYNNNEMNPDLGLGQISHSGNGQYTGELGLGQPNEGQFHEIDHSRGYNSSVQHMNWSL
ncbi:hypothetical protein ACJIZ3_025803 [Penstemon smallii]|uniref:Uncharacterized protein n=1 Tax=Penstemon smallii TaxID=265156 RepID=A0ABD3TWL9_9LAMI